MRNCIAFVLLSCLASAAQSQGINVPLSPEYTHAIDRLEIKYGSKGTVFQTGFKAYNGQTLARWLDSLRADVPSFTKVDAFNYQYLGVDNWEFSPQAEKSSEKALWNTFFDTRSDVYAVDKPEFQLRVNPVLHGSVGRARGDNQDLFINTRGLEVRGLIDDKVGFYTFFTENQAYFPDYVRANIGKFRAVPGEAFFKNYKEGRGVDFFSARGYISVNATKHINIQAGHDRFAIGNGLRSLILSDFTTPYTFLKATTNVWRIQYTNLFAEMRAEARRDYPVKYMALHRLGVNITKNLNVGVYEALIFGQPDSVGSGFEIGYMNPIIFYRAIEQYNGSKYNALLGMDFKWNLWQRISLYGQIVLDEFKIDEMRGRTEWWGNKFAYQLGAKYIDFLGVKQLDIQAEYNLARPYTYSHITTFTSYSHYNQPLAHPLGANFKEWVGVIRYQPLKRWTMTAKLFKMEFGVDSVNAISWGGEVDKSYVRRVQRPDDRGHSLLQGAKNTVYTIDLGVAYQLRHSLFLEARYAKRDQQSETARFNRLTNFYTLSVRWNIPQRLQDF